MGVTTLMAKGRDLIRYKKPKRTNTGDDKPLPELPATGRAPDKISIPNEPAILPKSSVATSDSGIPTVLPIKDSKKPEEAILQENEVDDVSSTISSPPSRLDSAKISRGEIENLWDVAYDTLRPQHADLLEKYEKILTLWLRAHSLQQNEETSHNHQQENLFQPSHHQERRQYAQDIIAFCLESQQEGKTGADTVEGRSKNTNSQAIPPRFSKQIRDLLKSSIDSGEDTAFAWAGTCLALQALLHSINRPETLQGINHVVSRMAWYTLLPKLLGGDEYKGGLPFSEKTILRDRITELYQQVLLFQARIVCSQIDASQESNSIGIDQNRLPRDADLNKADVVRAEQSLLAFNAKAIEIHIQKLSTLLSDKKIDITGVGKPEPTKSDTKTPKEILNAIDPRKSEANIPSVNNLYEWVKSTYKYKSFIAGDSRVLWVCGDPDAGRTMVIWSIVRGLSPAILDSEPKFLSFSMRGTGENEAQSTISVLKTLIYLVLEYQPQLGKYLIQKCKSTDIEEFSDFHDVYALTMLLYDMIRDETFKPTIFLVEGIDELNFEHEDPNSFILLIETTMKLSQNIKWLISSSTESFGRFSNFGNLRIAEEDCIDIDAAYEEMQTTLRDYYIPSKADQIANNWVIKEEFRNEITRLLEKASSGNFLRKKWETGIRANDSRYRGFLSVIYESHRLLHFHSMIQGAAGLTAKTTLLFCPYDTAIQQTFLPKEWPYLEGPPMSQNHWQPISHILKGHSDFTCCCAYSNDGKLLASRSDDGTIRLWNTSSGRTQHTIRAFPGDYQVKIALSSAGFIAASNKKTVKIWSLSTGQQLKLPVEEYLPSEPNAIGDIKFSNDGNMLAAAVGRDVVIWHVPDCKLILRQKNASPDDDVRVRSIAFSKHDTLLGSVAKQTITIWSLESDVADDLNGEGHNSEPTIQHSLRLKRQKDLTISMSYNNHASGIVYNKQACGIAFSPNQKYVAIGTYKPNNVYIWEWKSGSPPVNLVGHMGGINAVEFSSDGLFLASASYDETIRLWREPWNAKQTPLILSEHSGSVLHLAFSPSETRLATCSSDHTIRIWDYGYYKAQVQSEIDSEHSQSTPHTQPILRIALSEDGKWVASACVDGLICLWDSNSGMLRRNLEGHKQPVRSLVFSHDSRKLISVSDATVRIWSLEDDFQSRTLLGHRGVVGCAVLSPDGTLLASGSSDTTVRIWDLTQPGVGGTKSTHEEEGRWEMGETGESNSIQGVRLFYGHRGFVLSVLFSQDGRYVVSGAADGGIMLWDLHTGHQTGSPIQVTTIKDMNWDPINAMTFSADSKRFIASDAEGISIWDITREHGKMRFEYTLKSETRPAIHSLSVNINHPQYMITERGPILIQELRGGVRARIMSEPWCPYSVMSGTETWVTWQGRKIILLPDQYHPASDKGNHALRVHKDRVIVGCQTGEVLIFRFKKNANWLDVL
ncbi:hypothetical protein MKX08_004126 [Trichoderma sp. CBMAI-0020]|nr:hypothetical protein MKX08_004126 [Trichoderma sp. CBMAI-0020]